MALSRDSRLDRRRRVLLDASNTQTPEIATTRRSTSAISSEPGAKKSAGYSQDVRQTCGTRLVQLIPVRRRSFLALIAISLSTTACLMLVHYLVYVSGYLPWYGHPLVITLDLTHPQSIGSWLGSHLWLLCLGATILTFQLRRYKLDDYNGEYRLWFWMVFTCMLASIDSTTHMSELFALGLDKWAKVNLGWSGKAVVAVTMTTLVGLLGLRLCSELKTVPFSLVCWLFGLIAWAGSTALAQEQFLSNMAIQTRVWLRASLWLGGLTSIWIAAVAYLRHVYIDAQRRFLARGPLARRSVPLTLRQRVRQSMPFGRRRKGDTTDPKDLADDVAKRWSLRRVFGRRTKAATVTVQPASHRSQPVQPFASSTTNLDVQSKLNQESTAGIKNSSSTTPLSPGNRSETPVTSSGISGRSSQAEASKSAQVVSNTSSSKTSQASELSVKRKSLWPFRFKLWPGRDIPEEEAQEYCKIRDQQRERLASERTVQRQAVAAERAAAKEARRAEREAAKQAKRDEQSKIQPPKKHLIGGVGKKLLAPIVVLGRVLRSVKLPSLSAFKLNPPSDDAGSTTSMTTDNSSMKPIGQDTILPSTSRPGSNPSPNTNQSRSSSANYQDDDEDADDDRQMSKADRKKMRRQNRAA